MSLPSSVETVLLDAGGVLLDLDYGYLRRLIQAGHRTVDGAELSRAEGEARREIERAVAGGAKPGSLWRDYFHIILGQVGVPGAEHETIIDSLWEAHERIGLWTVAIPGAPETVVELKRRGFRIGVVSNAEGRVERDLAAAGYAGLFDTVVDSAVVGVEKPDPEIFRLALERVGGRAATAIFLGDVPAVDVAGARAAGVAPILVDRHGLYPGLQPQVRSIVELPALLDGQNSAA